MHFKTIPSCIHPAAVQRWILAVVLLVEGFLFLGYHHERWYKGLVPLNGPQTRAGEGLVVRCDGLGYYAWLRSLLIDGDWSFDNEFDEHNVLGDFVPPPAWRTPTGRRALPWSVGPACWWALMVVPGHACLTWLQDAGVPWPADGYSLPYQLLVGGATLLASGLGLVFLYGICRQYARPVRAALAAAVLTLGTTIVFYGAIEVSMAHGVGTMAVAALTWYWLRTYGSERARRWLVVGLLVGLVALVRWQLATFALLPAGEALLALRRRLPHAPDAQARDARTPSFARWANTALAAVGAVVGFLPQLIAWRCVYGQWLASPIPTEPHWLTPSLGSLLLSWDRGLFTWTPLALVGFLGYACALRRPEGGADSAPAGPGEPLFLLLVAFLLQVQVLGSLWGGQVYLGVAYGFRQLTESLVVLGPGLALLLERTRRPVFRVLCVACCVLTGWNLLLIAQYRYGLLPAAGPADPLTMAANALRLIGRKKAHLLGQVVMGPALLAWLACASGTLRETTSANRRG